MAAAKIWKGFGTRVLANDVRENPSLEGVVEYVGLEELLRESHLVSLHCPLLPSTFHLLNAERCAWTVYAQIPAPELACSSASIHDRHPRTVDNRKSSEETGFASETWCCFDAGLP